MSKYRIKLADSDIEREQIHELNYKTFVEEIPQHEPNAERRLVDRFDYENEFVIATTGDGSVVGMLALRASRPFSLDQKLPDLEGFLPPHRSVCELRLLAVRPEYRHRRLLRDLMAFAARRCIEVGHDLAVISGTTRQLELYRRIGFEPFGPMVGAEGARYQPMYLTLEKFLACVGDSLGIERRRMQSTGTVSFLPGPVAPDMPVRTAFGGAVLSHRSPEFVALIRQVRGKLCKLTGAADAALLLGCGTLANDIVASCIAARGGRGLVLANGEFGERLADHAHRAALEFEVLRQPWGAPFDEGQTLNVLRRIHAEWLWAAHCETSTGVLNDLGMLKRVVSDAGAELYLDCVSSIGTVEVDLAGVRLASCASGKGLGAYAGLAAVLFDSLPPRQPVLVPRYLDLNLWLECESVPFTHSSSLVAALDAALSQTDWQTRLSLVARDARWLRTTLRARGLRVLAPEDAASPGVTTIDLPGTVRSSDVASALGQAGFEVAWRSVYLTQRNWIQIALMGEYDRSALRELPDAVQCAVRACLFANGRAA
jgi:aspartate aminotransferase-like enzyme/GNAT superfamily N-acetyltransferase